MEQLFEKYLNIQKFATAPEYRGLELLEPKFYEYAEFREKMQEKEFILHKFKKNDTKIDLYLFSVNSRQITQTDSFKKLLDKYTEQKTLIMITREELNTYRKKSILQYTNLTIYNYLHKHFKIELSKGPLCSSHRIATRDEVEIIKRDICNDVTKLPQININDPQNIWIGPKIGDVIIIESISEMSGNKLSYQYVVPEVGQSNKEGLSKKQTKKTSDKLKLLQNKPSASKLSTKAQGNQKPTPQKGKKSSKKISDDDEFDNENDEVSDNEVGEAFDDYNDDYNDNDDDAPDDDVEDDDHEDNAEYDE